MRVLVPDDAGGLMHIRVEGEDLELLRGLAQATGRKQSTIASLGISWFVRQPQLAPVPVEVMTFVQTCVARGWTGADFVALLTLMGTDRPAEVLEMQRRLRDR